IRRTDDAEPVRSDEAPSLEIDAHSLEVIESALTIELQRGLMPFRAELAAAADVRDCNRAALRKPWRSRIQRTVSIIAVPGRERQFEATIRVQNGRQRPMHTLGMN